jgi:hypothetical protein
MTLTGPADLLDRPRDLRYGVPVPFACQDDEGRFEHGVLVKARVVQCALSRVCGLCGRSLSWGVTFLGSPEEADANVFHFPPLHRGCAEAALDLYAPLGVPVLGQSLVVHEWALVVTGGFELIRPESRAGDMRMRSGPNSVTEGRRILAEWSRS